MSDVVNQHRAEAPQQVRAAVVTISDTRTLATDRGGQLIVDLLTAAGHTVAARELVRDEPRSIEELVRGFAARGDIDALLMTGGTGLSSRDRTFETVTPLLTKALPGYGELFRMLSFAEIGAAAMLSRAIGGLVQHMVVLTMPGSPAAVQLAMEKLILPELPHLLREARR